MFAPASATVPNLHRPATILMNSGTAAEMRSTARKTQGNHPAVGFTRRPVVERFDDSALIMKTFTFALAAALAAAFPALASDTAKPSTCGECCGQTECAGLVQTYEKVSTALAADDFTAAKAAAINLACCLKCEDQAELSAKVDMFTKSASLADARILFKGISAAIVPLAEKEGDCFIMTCPMARADWIQTTATVANPYYGSQMLRCGSIKKTIKTGS